MLLLLIIKSVYHWLLSKYVTRDESVREGFNTKQSFEEQQGKSETDEQPVPDNKKKRSRKVRDELYDCKNIPFVLHFQILSPYLQC